MSSISSSITERVEIPNPGRPHRHGEEFVEYEEFVDYKEWVRVRPAEDKTLPEYRIARWAERYLTTLYTGDHKLTPDLITCETDFIAIAFNLAYPDRNTRYLKRVGNTVDRYVQYEKERLAPIIKAIEAEEKTKTSK